MKDITPACACGLFLSPSLPWPLKAGPDHLDLLRRLPATHAESPAYKSSYSHMYLGLSLACSKLACLNLANPQGLLTHGGAPVIYSIRAPFKDL
ncbi:hypothetical protein N656DRAFT_414237 [Canariomyces notabilis]|uniref:Uncharacterized protein n=1 Tax=Canariomyces notabilis TaxID=2074819 RepID=A0AAN6QEE1_9PEZI|nr:hypothetical protein N656DRAFT_414237 [Canariomyces arenarius]